MATPISGERYNQQIDSSKFFKSYASLSATDLIAEGNAASRWIVVPAGGAGTVIVKRLDGETVTLPAMATDWAHLVQAAEIVGGTATNVLVHW